MKTAASISSKDLSALWLELCELHLPVIAGDGWRYSRGPLPGDPDQGWKLHISATILSAVETLKKVAPLLKERGCLYKAPITLLELGKLNSGIHYNYTQVGKFITIYPQDSEDVAALAGALHQLTLGIPAPSIPFDTRYRSDSNVYYRYGAFNTVEMEQPDGSMTPAIRDPQGELVPDDRDALEPPAWVTSPFPASPKSDIPGDNPLKTKYRVLRPLSQRGKGGVYNGIDLSGNVPRLCVIKEGRQHGEVDWDGADGVSYVKREASNLEALADAGLGLPAIYSTFELSGNFYLVTEYIEGETLYDTLRERRRRLSFRRALELAAEVSRLMRRVHTAGWAWHDCKPSNIIIAKDGTLRPVDFEGARALGDPKALIWGSSEFLPPEWQEGVSGESIVSSDLYALGAMIYFLLAGRYYDNKKPVPVEKFRRNIPARTGRLVSELLSADPKKRPDTAAAIDILAADRTGLFG